MGKARYFGVSKGWCPHCEEPRFFSHTVGFTGTCHVCKKGVINIYEFPKDKEDLSGFMRTKDLDNNDIIMDIFYPAIPSTSPAYRVTVRLCHEPTGVIVSADGKSHSKTKREAVQKLYAAVQEFREVAGDEA